MPRLKTKLFLAAAALAAATLPASAQLRGGQAAGQIVAFEHPDFRGQSRAFDRAVPDLNYLRFNDTISSLQLRGTWEVCEHPDFRGRCEIVNGPVYDLNDIRMNDTITSMRPVAYGGRGYAGERPRQRGGHRARGVEGRYTVFFAQPRDGYGEFIRNDRGAAQQFCRQQGYRGVAYAGRAGRVLSDVLCEK